MYIYIFPINGPHYNINIYYLPIIIIHNNTTISSNFPGNRLQPGYRLPFKAGLVAKSCFTTRPALPISRPDGPPLCWPKSAGIIGISLG